jgi:hypothetical protein
MCGSNQQKEAPSKPCRSSCRVGFGGNRSRKILSDRFSPSIPISPLHLSQRSVIYLPLTAQVGLLFPCHTPLPSFSNHHGTPPSWGFSFPAPHPPNLFFVEPPYPTIFCKAHTPLPGDYLFFPTCPPPLNVVLSAQLSPVKVSPHPSNKFGLSHIKGCIDPTNI